MGRRRRRRRAQRAHRRRLSRTGGPACARLGATRPARRCVHPRAPLRRPAFRDESVRGSSSACSTHSVIGELDLPRRGHRASRSTGESQWTPFEDGTAVFQWHDHEKTARSVAAISPSDVEGFLAYDALFERIRDRLRNGPRGDLWLGDAPDRPELEELFADDPEAREVLLDASIADVVERHVREPAAAHRVARSGCDRHLRRSPRPGDRVDSTPITASGSSAGGRSWREVSVGCRSSLPTRAKCRGDAGGGCARGRVSNPVKGSNSRTAPWCVPESWSATRSGAHARTARRGRRKCTDVRVGGRRLAYHQPGRQGELRAVTLADVSVAGRSKSGGGY